MPVYLLTWHAYRSWMPDRSEGYVERGEGVQPPNESRARGYAARASEPEVVFTHAIQRTAIHTILESREPLDLTTYAVATEPTHVHALVGWRSERTWESMAKSLRSSLTRTLNEEHGRRTWFAESRSRKRVHEEEHFEYLLRDYLPSHRGWYWSEREGWRDPLV